MALEDGTTSARVTTATDASGAAIVSISGELDISNIDAIERECAPVIDGPSDHVVFDLRDLTFMDSSGLAMLLRAARRTTVEVRNPSHTVRRVIDATGLTEILHLDS